MRLTSRWVTASTLPPIRVRIATAQSTGVQLGVTGCSATTKMRTNPTKAATLVPTDMNAVTEVGAPTYTSGVHAWNGTAETLKQKPTAIRPSPASSSGPKPEVVCNGCVETKVWMACRLVVRVA